MDPHAPNDPPPTLLAPRDPSPGSPAPAAEPRRRLVLFKLWLKRVLIASAALALLAALSVVLVIRHYESGLPSVEQLKRGYDPPQVTRILARDGSLLGNVFTERRTVIPLSDVPDHAKLAFLA